MPCGNDDFQPFKIVKLEKTNIAMVAEASLTLLSAVNMNPIAELFFWESSQVITNLTVFKKSTTY